MSPQRTKNRQTWSGTMKLIPFMEEMRNEKARHIASVRKGDKLKAMKGNYKETTTEKCKREWIGSKSQSHGRKNPETITLMKHGKLEGRWWSREKGKHPVLNLRQRTRIHFYFLTDCDYL